MVNLRDLIELENLQGQRSALRPLGKSRAGSVALLVTLSKKRNVLIPKARNGKNLREPHLKGVLHQGGSGASGIDGFYPAQGASGASGIDSFYALCIGKHPKILQG